jgi:hypothetical protein
MKQTVAVGIVKEVEKKVVAKDKGAKAPKATQKSDVKS